MEQIKLKKHFDLCDFVEEQSFIEAEHRNGYRLIGRSGGNFTFEACAPDEYVYRMDCMRLKEQDEILYIEQFADIGWELAEIRKQSDLFHIKSGYKWYYFCKKKSPVEGENEINNIPNRLRTCLKISKLYNIELVLLILVIALLNMLYSNMGVENIFLEFLYMVFTFVLLYFVGRYFFTNLGMSGKIKQLLSAYTIID